MEGQTGGSPTFFSLEISRRALAQPRNLPRNLHMVPLAHVSKKVSFEATREAPQMNNLQVSNVCCKSIRWRATNRRMEKVIRKYASLDALKADEYRDWQQLPVHERMKAVADITLAAYQMKEPAPDVRRLQRTLVHLQRPER